MKRYTVVLDLVAQFGDAVAHFFVVAHFVDVMARF